MSKYTPAIEWENANEAYSNDGIECPHCHDVDDDPESIYIDEGQIERHTCDNCGKEFTVSMYVSRSWTTLPIHPEFNP